MVLAFITPFIAFATTIPSCVMGGICVLLYGFIAISGFKMMGHVDFDDNRNIFVMSAILVAGIGGLSLHFGSVTITSVATAMLLGIVINLIASRGKQK